MMNGSLYEETSNSRSSVEVVQPAVSSGPLHIPAKRISSLAVTPAYGHPECGVDGAGGVIRHPHQTQPWGTSPYENHSAFEGHQYNHQTAMTPGYYYNDRDRKPPIKFWSNSYDLPSAGPSTVATTDTCQTFQPQSWCNYAPYSGRHMEAHHHATSQSVAYLSEDRTRAPIDGFTHSDGYTLRTFAPAETHPQPTYVPAGTGKLKKNLIFNYFPLNSFL